MRIEAPQVLTAHRGVGVCFWCGRSCNREASHLFGRQRGDANRNDARWNVRGLGGPWHCACHRKSHDGHEPTGAQLVTRVAGDLGTEPSVLVAAHYFLVRVPKDWPEVYPDRLQAAIEAQDKEIAKYIWQALEDGGYAGFAAVKPVLQTEF